MRTISQDELLSMIYEVFGSVFQECGFAISEFREDLVIAKRDGVELICRLEYSYHRCHFSLEIRLSGELGEKATSEAKYRHLGVIAVARCLDSQYARHVKGAESLDELRQIMIDDKEDLIRYCKDILAGDVSPWQRVVDCLHENAGSGSTKLAIPERRDTRK